MIGVSKGGRGAFRGAVAAALLLAVAGCTTPFQARVQHYQAMPPIQGQTFAIVPGTDSQKGSLEFRTYAQMVGDKLRVAGFQPAASEADAQFLVQIDYSSGPARERVATRDVGMGMGWGWGPYWGRGGWGGWGYDPFWGQPEVYSYTIYPTRLDVRIMRAVDKESVFEGTAETTTRTNDLTVTVPKLVEALFQNFPGERVQSQIVKVPPKK